MRLILSYWWCLIETKLIMLINKSPKILMIVFLVLILDSSSKSSQIRGVGVRFLNKEPISSWTDIDDHFQLFLHHFTTWRFINLYKRNNNWRLNVHSTRESAIKVIAWWGCENIIWQNNTHSMSGEWVQLSMTVKNYEIHSQDLAVQK